MTCQVPVIIVGNKYDLDGIRQVTFEKAMEWARHFGSKPMM
jgi:GTPase SAR1 family protein